MTPLTILSERLNMPQVINVSEEDISYAEKILLPEGKVFDPERRAFIRNLNTIDLQAVPGSGKTTALLAKLLILERKLPFEDGSGVLVISHTNAAIDEIKVKVYRHCPRLFSYPNYVGTIQGFVDQFLAIPFSISKFKKKPNRIDNQIYDEAVQRRFPLNLNGFEIQEQSNARYYLKANNYENVYRLAYRNGAVCLVKSINGNELDISRPKSKVNGKDFTDSEKVRVKEWLIKFKLSIMQSECIMHFDDAYFLAELYINKIAPVKILLQKRFSFVFVDEMQDMDTHQYNLLENIFFDYGQALSKYQRIGDKNQAIFNSVKADEVWSARAEVLKLSASQRLSKPIANVVKRFALEADPNFDIVGLNVSDIKPHILVFDDESIKKIIPTFIEVLKKNNLFNPDLSVKVICWNTDWKDDEVSRQAPEKLRLENYFDGYRKEQSVPRQDYDCLKSYLLYFDKNKRTLKTVRQNILNALLKLLRFEQIYDSSQRPYTLNKLIDFVRDTDAQKYEELNLNLYNWSIELIKGNADAVWEQVKTYTHDFFSIFSKSITTVGLNFINNDSSNPQPASIAQPVKPNTNFDGDIKVEVTTVHAVKGQTHAATLYLESCYQGKHESERLASQFLGVSFNERKVHHKSSVKMTYVGFSRPTDLLCVAIHKSRFEKYLSGINRSDWVVEEVAP